MLSTLAAGPGDYGFLQGTSMASAHASGVAALLLGCRADAAGAGGGATAARLREVLLATAEDRGAPGRDDHYGAGIIDAASAVRALAGIAPPADPRLALATPSVALSAEESALDVPFRNVGGGTLVAGAPGGRDRRRRALAHRRRRRLRAPASRSIATRSPPGRTSATSTSTRTEGPRC